MLDMGKIDLTMDLNDHLDAMVKYEVLDVYCNKVELRQEHEGLDKHDPNFQAQIQAFMDFIWRAYKVARFAHRKAKRKDGAPYITHPIGVAVILACQGFDHWTLSAALLHDVLEDSTEVVKKDLDRAFGLTVSNIVDRVTIATKDEKRKNDINKQVSLSEEMVIEPTTEPATESTPKPTPEPTPEPMPEPTNKKIDAVQENNLKRAVKMQSLLTKTGTNYAALSIKMADRLHNLRTLKSMPKGLNRDNIITETRTIYARLAENLGLYMIKQEIDELCFRNENPQAYAEIYQALRDLDRKVHVDYSAFLKELNGLCKNTLLPEAKFEITSRRKQLASINRKMMNSHVPFSEIHDIYAARILVTSTAECYLLFSTIQTKYQEVDGRSKDYIARPKKNGYESLHLTLQLTPTLQVEVQIRTFAMHEKNEHGLAAHWVYKDGTPVLGQTGKRIWKNIKEIINSMIGPKDNLNAADQYINLTEANAEVMNKPDKVNTYTPNNKLITLSDGATVLDFAYKVHSDIGDHYVMARVNGKLVARSYILQENDVVQIETSPKVQVRASWLTDASESLTRNRIKRELARNITPENVRKGKAKVQRKIMNMKLARNVSREEVMDAAVIRAYERQIGTSNDLNLIFNRLALFPNDKDNRTWVNRLSKGLLYTYFSLQSPEKLKELGVKAERDRNGITYNLLDTSELEEEKMEEDEDFDQESFVERRRELPFLPQALPQGGKLLYHFLIDQQNIIATPAKCCRPQPGDIIVGYKSSRTKSGESNIRIHRKDCKDLEAMHQRAIQFGQEDLFLHKLTKADWIPEEDPDGDNGESTEGATKGKKPKNKTKGKKG